MAEEGRYIDIRSNGDGVIGRVHENVNGEEVVTPFKGSTRKELLKEVRRKYSVKTNIAFNRRGKTYF
jgi:hypothetical protein